MNYLIVKSEKQFVNKKFVKINKGDLISIVYYDIEKESIRLQSFIGRCIMLKNKSLSTKIVLSNYLNNVKFTQSFFLYSPSVLDIKVLQKK